MRKPSHFNRLNDEFNKLNTKILLSPNHLFNPPYTDRDVDRWIELGKVLDDYSCIGVTEWTINKRKLYEFDK